MNLNLPAIGIFGPGSEWFWAMAQFLVLSVTGLAIYRQLRAQGSANALDAQESLLARWESPEMLRVRLAALLHIAARLPGEPPTLGIAGNFFANMAALRAHRHLQPTDSWEMWSAQVQFWWALEGPYLATLRARNPGTYGEFEELAATMTRLDRENKVPNFDPDDLDGRIEREIGRLIARLELERDATLGLIPTRPVPQPVQGADGETTEEVGNP